jgi:hypothetical protein
MTPFAYATDIESAEQSGRYYCNHRLLLRGAPAAREQRLATGFARQPLGLTPSK